MEIRSERLLLREVDYVDVELLMKCFNNKQINKYLGENPYPFSKNHALEEITYCQEMANQSPRVYYPFIIDLENNGIGEIGLSGVHTYSETKPVQNSAYLSFWLLEEYWGKGIMSETLDSIIPFSFNDLDLEFLYADVSKENIPSCSLLEKKGFVSQGKESLFISPNWDMEKDFLYALYRNRK